MSITSLTATPVLGGAYRLDWASDLPGLVTFYVYRDGQRIVVTERTSILVQPPAVGSPVYEVFDDDLAAPAFVFPNYALLAWYAVAGAASYRVEQLVSGQWAEQTTLDDDGRGYFTWRSSALADGQTHQFRVTPTGTNGNAGTARSFTLLMVRIPNAPDFVASYSAGTGQVTFSAP